MSEWQPIETAPLGKEILLYCPGIHGNGGIKEDICIGVLGQNSYYKYWRISGVTGYEYWEIWDYDEITHWMDKPEPPSE